MLPKVILERARRCFNVCRPVVLLSIKIKSISVQTQLNYIYYRELHVPTYLRSSWSSQLVFKTHRGKIYTVQATAVTKGFNLSNSEVVQGLKARRSPGATAMNGGPKPPQFRGLQRFRAAQASRNNSNDQKRQPPQFRGLQRFRAAQASRNNSNDQKRQPPQFRGPQHPQYPPKTVHFRCAEPSGQLLTNNNKYKLQHKRQRRTIKEAMHTD